MREYFLRITVSSNFYKRMIALFVTFTIITATLVTPISAETVVNIVLDGEEVVFTEDMGFPFIDANNRTQVPLRVTLESFGATVNWDGEQEMASATIDDITVHVPINKSYILVNGVEVANDTEAVIVNSRTYCPIRKVLEAFGAVVTWEDTTKTVVVASEAYDMLTDDYTFLVFMNGTDLESTYDEEYEEFSAAGTTDIAEMTEIGSSDKVNFLLETGGTLEWENENIDASQNQRWLIEKDVITNVGNLGKQNMADGETLKAYILWAIENYPAKKYVLDLWNHGGGPIVGYGVDEYFEGDALVLEELGNVLESVKLQTGVTFEVIGFDACLMGAVETAQVVAPYAKYLVASEELEPGHGWNYTPIYSALINNPTMGGAELGKVIADGFYNQAVESETSAEVTLAVTDLSKIDLVTNAMDELFASIETDIDMDNDDNLTELYKVIANAKSFGGNTEEQGYTDITDLGDFAARLSDRYSDASQKVLDALSEVIVYKIGGKLHQKAHGLSVYLPYKDKEYFDENLVVLDSLDISSNHKSFVHDYVSSLSGIKVVEADQTGISVNVPGEDDSSYELVIGATLLNQTEDVLLNIYEIDEENNVYRNLGFDALAYYDETSETYMEDFGGYWAALDGNRVSLQVVYDEVDYIEYEIPVMINGVRMNIQATWFFDESEESGGYYEINGAREAINNTTNMPDKNVTVLKSGDVIEPIFSVFDMDTDEESEEIGNAIYYNEASMLSFDELESNDFMFRFEILDFSGESYFSDFYGIVFVP